MIWDRMVDFHLLARKNKDGSYTFHAAFPGDVPGKYRAMRSTKVEARKAKGWDPKHPAWTEASKAAARRVAHAMIEDGTVLSEDKNLEKYFLDFWTPGRSDYLKGQRGSKISPTYAQSNHQLLVRYFLPYFKQNGIKRLADIKRRHLRDWLDTAYDTYVATGKITAITLNNCRQAAWVVLRYAADNEVIPRHPGIGVDPLDESPNETGVFTNAELSRLFEVDWDDDRARMACLVSADTGMRLSEVRGLLVSCVYLTEGYIRVERGWVDPEKMKRTKTDKSVRTAFISDGLARDIRLYLNTHRWGANPGDFLIYNIDRQDRPIAVATINKNLSRAMDRAGIPHVDGLGLKRSFKSFRHTVATLWKGDGLLLQRQLGHSNIKMSEHYANHHAPELRDAILHGKGNVIPFKKAE